MVNAVMFGVKSLGLDGLEIQALVVEYRSGHLSNKIGLLFRVA